MANSRYFSFYNTSESRYESSNRSAYRSVSPRYSNIDLCRSQSNTLADYKGILKNSNSFHNHPSITNRHLYYYHDTDRNTLFHSKSSSNINRQSVEIPIERVYSSRIDRKSTSRNFNNNRCVKAPMINLDVAIQTPGSDIKISRRSKSYEVRNLLSNKTENKIFIFLF